MWDSTRCETNLERIRSVIGLNNWIEKVILKLTNASSFINLTDLWSLGKTCGSDVFSSILFFHMVIVKHETPHLHDFMVKLVIFHVNQVNFDQEQYTVASIQHKRHRNDRGTAAPALLLLHAAAPPLRAVWML